MGERRSTTSQPLARRTLPVLHRACADAENGEMLGVQGLTCTDEKGLLHRKKRLPPTTVWLCLKTHTCYVLQRYRHPASYKQVVVEPLKKQGQPSPICGASILKDVPSVAKGMVTPAALHFPSFNQNCRALGEAPRLPTKLKKFRFLRSESKVNLTKCEEIRTVMLPQRVQNWSASIGSHFQDASKASPVPCTSERIGLN